MNHFASGFNSALYPLLTLLDNIRCLTYISLNKFYPFILEINNHKFDSPS